MAKDKSADMPLFTAAQITPSRLTFSETETFWCSLEYGRKEKTIEKSHNVMQKDQRMIV